LILLVLPAVFPCAFADNHYQVKSGGDTTVRKADVNAFSLPSHNMSFERKVDFSVGNSFFRNPGRPPLLVASRQHSDLLDYNDFRR